jgi:phenylalanyl-tRNA synthetase beta subunit
LDAINEIADVKNIEVFDLYEWKNLGEGKKSISLKIKMTWDGTMTTEMINEVMKKCIQKAEWVGGKLRE